jgi:hypothetical protein
MMLTLTEGKTMSITSESASPARSWPADHIERWPIERLIPYANNARVHSEADLDKNRRRHQQMGLDDAGAGR